MAREHGKSTFSINGNIITVKAVGAYNLDGIKKTIKDLESAIMSFDGKAFKLLFDYLEIEGGTPEVFDKINECNIWLNSQNMVAKALVINSPTVLSILESRTPARKLQNSQTFDNKTSAIEWLNQQL